MSDTKCKVYTAVEFRQLLCSIYGAEIYADFSADGLYVGLGEEDIPVEDLHEKLAAAIGVEEVTSIHIDDNELPNVWIAHRERDGGYRTLITVASTENNTSAAMLYNQDLMDSLAADIEEHRPGNAAPTKVVLAWLESTGSYTYPPEEADEYELFGITYDPKGSPFGTPAALMKVWETDDDIYERYNISYIEMPLKNSSDNILKEEHNGKTAI